MKSGRAFLWVMGFGVSMAAGPGAFGQGIGPSLGTVELRWRERSTPGYDGSYTIEPGTAPGVDAVPTPSPSAASVTAQDASVVLVLEAKVTQAAGLTGNPIRGLYNGQFDIFTNQSTGGDFARQVVSDGVSQFNPRANARVTTTNLGFDPASLPSHSTVGSLPRALVSPFRRIADVPGPNGPALGFFRSGTNHIHKITAALSTGNLDEFNEDATHPGRYDLAGLNNWVPLYVVIYTITDVSTPRDIVFSLSAPVDPSGTVETVGYDFGTWRGQGNPANGFSDRWALSPGFTAPPTFTVHVIPAPGAAGAFALLGLALSNRRRQRIAACE